MGRSRKRRLVAVQTQPVFGEVEENLAAVERVISGLEADLVVLPELFATGYALRDADEVAAVAEPWPEGATVRRLCAWSRDTGGMIVGGFAERTSTGFCNSAAVVARGRALHCYRKIHLFGAEPDVFRPGDEDPPVVEVAGLRVGVMICFDWIFPEVARVLALDGADVLAHPSNLVLPWCQQAMAVRALENGVFVVTTNRVGVETRPPRPALRFTGGSLIVGPRGETLARAGGAQAEILRAAVDVARARNKTLPSGNDPFAERRPARYRRITCPKSWPSNTLQTGPAT